MTNEPVLEGAESCARATRWRRAVREDPLAIAASVCALSLPLSLVVLRVADRPTLFALVEFVGALAALVSVWWILFLTALIAWRVVGGRPRSGLAIAWWTCALAIGGYLLACRLDSPDHAIALADPIADAILAYEESRGLPPERLEELVPEYLARVPEVDTFGYGPLRYRRDREPARGAWALRVLNREKLSEEHSWGYSPNWTIRPGEPRRGRWVEERWSD